MKFSNRKNQSLRHFCLLFFASVSAVVAEQPENPRVQSGLVVLYDFQADSGDVVYDRAGSKQPINLKIEDAAAVRRFSGSLQIRSETLIRNNSGVKRLMSAIKRSGELTAEVWIEPRSTNQSGPARILSLSKNSTQRNLTLGQDGDRFDVRFRSTETSDNGLPSVSSESGAVTRDLTHLVYTRTASGDTRVYVNGQVNIAKSVEGTVKNWNRSYSLMLGNERDGSRPWLGTYHLVAIYSRALSEQEVQQNYAAGSGVQSTLTLAKVERDPRELHFELDVAPILANQCLECHDSLARKGGLDLSKKDNALAGGDSGDAIVRGNLDESLIWQSIEADEMPLDRDPLTDSQKATIRKWLEDGAAWSLASIDPAVYVHGGRPDANWLRRLTLDEYVESISSIFGVDIREHATTLLPRDFRADGFSNTAYNLNVDLKHIEAYQQLAEIVVDQIDALAFAERFHDDLKFTDREMGELIGSVGKYILRGPLNQSEIIAYRGISTTTAATDDGNMEEAIRLIIEAMLQSPRFLYRVETQRGDGSVQPLDEYELASRLSYTILGAPPDLKLIKAADDGDLFDEQEIARHVDRLLKDPRAATQASRFFADWLNLGRLENMQPSPEKFSGWHPEIASDMRRESLAFFHDVAWVQDRPLADLLNAKVTFLTPRLAEHYGLQSNGQANELVRYDLSGNTSRGGMLTQGALLTVGGDEASMVTRGLLVMHELLRGVVKDPPACVDTTPVPTKPGLSQRAIAEQRIANTNCGGCHGRFEPLAFGLERYDGVGAYHETDEHGNTLREDGEILFPGASQSVRYKSSAELMDLMAASDRVKESITWKLTQFALGRPLTAADAGDVQNIHQQSMENGGTYRATLKAIVASELITMIRTDK